MSATTISLLTGFLLISSPWTPNGKQQIHETLVQRSDTARTPVKEGTPFGLHMGMTLTEIGGNPKKAAPGMYIVTSVPEPHSAFESYVLQVGPEAGLCWVKGIGKNIQTSVYGVELKSAFNQMKERLQQFYGAPDVTDFLMTGSIWNEPKDWMMALIKKERALGATWKDKRKTTLPSNMQSVFLGVSPLAQIRESSSLSMPSRMRVSVRLKSRSKRIVR